MKYLRTRITLSLLVLLSSISLSTAVYAEEGAAGYNLCDIETVVSEFKLETGDFGPRFVLYRMGARRPE